MSKTEIQALAATMGMSYGRTIKSGKVVYYYTQVIDGKVITRDYPGNFNQFAKMIKMRTEVAKY